MLSGHQNEHLTIYNQSAKSEWQDGVGSKVNVVQMFWRRSVQFSCHVQCCEKLLILLRKKSTIFQSLLRQKILGPLGFIATWDVLGAILNRTGYMTNFTISKVVHSIVSLARLDAINLIDFHEV